MIFEYFVFSIGCYVSLISGVHLHPAPSWPRGHSTLGIEKALKQNGILGQ